MHMDINAFLTV